MGSRSHREGPDGNAGCISAGLCHVGSQGLKLEHSQGVKALSDEELEAAIAVLEPMVAAHMQRREISPGIARA